MSYDLPFSKIWPLKCFAWQNFKNSFTYLVTKLPESVCSVSVQTDLQDRSSRAHLHPTPRFMRIIQHCFQTKGWGRWRPFDTAQLALSRGKPDDRMNHVFPLPTWKICSLRVSSPLAKERCSFLQTRKMTGTNVTPELSVDYRVGLPALKPCKWNISNPTLSQTHSPKPRWRPKMSAPAKMESPVLWCSPGLKWLQQRIRTLEREGFPTVN